MKNPIQPLFLVDDIIRFKENKIVNDLLQFATDKGFGLNQIALRNYSIDDQEQFAQLIGYSLSGYGELSYVTDESYNTAFKMYENSLDEKEAKIAALEEMIKQVREGLKIASCAVFKIHSDDLDIDNLL